jgi:pSer/pThr/pTyr-binding forkhead associated (FHA) protein
MSITPTGDPTGALAAFGVQVGPQAGDEVPIHLPVVSVGRASQNDIVIPDDSVSTTHSRLEYQDGAWRITDLGSKNGTYVEGVRLAPEVPTPLPFGSTVRFGGTRLHFRPVQNADPEKARASYSAPPPPETIRTRRSGFRLPVWLLAVILILLAIAALVLGWLWTEPLPTAPPTTAALYTSPGVAPRIDPYVVPYVVHDVLPGAMREVLL